MTRDYLFAARLKAQTAPVATCFYIQLNLHNHWSFMVRNFEELVLTHKETESDRADAGRQRNHAGRFRIEAARRKMGRYAGTCNLLLIVACGVRGSSRRTTRFLTFSEFH